MEFTCLSQGKGFYFPPCHILDVSGFRILFDCPIDLSSLTIFSPLLSNAVSTCTNHFEQEFTCSCQTTSKISDNRPKPLDANAFIRAEPRYKTVTNLLLWNVGFIDIVLITSSMGMLGLPFLTKSKDFSAKVYVTEVAARIGGLMMEDLVSMNKEFRQFYGPESDVPEWMKWDEIDKLPLELKKIVIGDDGTEFAGWMPLYSAADVKDCMAKITSLKYGEEVCYNGTLIVNPSSSGLDIGSCNWSITSPKGRISYVSGSVSMSATAMGFDYKPLQLSDVILYSDISSCNATENLEDDSLLSDNVDLEESFTKLNEDEYLEETEKFDFIFSCSMDSVKAGGSVLIPIGRLGGILQLLEQFALSLESEDVKVPVYLVSSVAEELLAFCNIIPEWLCRERQDKLYSGHSLFTHVEMLKDGRLHVYPAIHSLELLKNWQEPCIVICPHWSLRLGPVVHLLQRWSRDQNSLLIMEKGVDANLALLPFKPISMKVLQCSFLSGLKAHHSQLILKILQPQHILFPEALKRHVCHLESLFILGYYSLNKMLNIPFTKESELDIAIEVVTRLRYTTLKEQNLAMSRLKGELVMEQGRHRLFLGNEPVCSETDTRQVFSFGRIDSGVLVKALQKIGMNVTAENNSEAAIVRVSEPHEALIQVTESETLISTANENVASLISQAVYGILDCL